MAKLNLDKYSAHVVYGHYRNMVLVMIQWNHWTAWGSSEEREKKKENLLIRVCNGEIKSI